MAIPVGIITIWNGALASIPSGWKICDGTSGTPDLRGYFIRGASSDGEVNGVGGSTQHTHTSGAFSNSAGGGHWVDISISANTSSERGTGLGGSFLAADKGHGHSGGGASTGGHGSHNHSIVTSVGDSSSYPPYFKLFYIMKI